MTHDQTNAVFQRAIWQQQFYEAIRINAAMRGKTPAHIVMVSDDQVQRDAWREGRAIALAVLKQVTSGLPRCAVGLGDDYLAKLSKLSALIQLSDMTGNNAPLRDLLDVTGAATDALLANINWRAIKRRADGRALATGTLQ